jgi:hypothetical protein
VIDGYIEIQIQGTSKRYGVGDIFELEFNQTTQRPTDRLGLSI